MNLDPSTRAALLEALAWQIELGADEAIAERPIDRFAEAAAQPTGRSDAPSERPAAPATSRPAGKETPIPADRPAGDLPSAEAAPLVPPAAELAAAADCLSALAEAMRTWEGSDLRRGARSFVFSDGRPGARLMVIGEAPGGEEDRLGKPFVGRAGQLLDRMLAAIGLSRHAEDPAEAAYIANILPWRPPGNRTPSEVEVAAFLPFVERHIALAAPEVLLSVGNTPTRALLATTTGIKRMRGRWHRHEATGLPLLASFHPAYLLRQPADKRLAWEDMRLLRARLDGRG